MMQFSRSSGILLHISSLPSAWGIGSLGAEARTFIDFLADADQRIWQICPLGPTGYGDSPYQTFSAFAGNPLFIDLPTLRDADLLSDTELQEVPAFSQDAVEYGPVIEWKQQVLRRAFQRFQPDAAFEDFCQAQAFWLDDYALFMALKKHFSGMPWSNWMPSSKLRQPAALHHFRQELAEEISFHCFCQFCFFTQWDALHQYAKAHRVQIMGDMPIFVAFDSADAWAHPELFHFDEERNPTVVAGVPPDFFSATGQLWGNPLYNWQAMEAQNFTWWHQRFASILQQVDIIRVDHFRGFAAYWAVPATAETAINGSWEPALGQELFISLKHEMGTLPIVAEDLGVITPDVEKLRDELGFPGMKILQFAFGDDMSNPYLPHNYQENCLVYTGTHDNDTTLGWYSALDDTQRHQVRTYLQCSDTEMPWALIEAAWRSRARIAIAPMQDILSLGAAARMNTPGEAAGNWQWRLHADALTHDLARRLRNLTWDAKR
jgi:4-alpha-glucanotransferase